MRQRIASKRKPSFCWAANDAITVMVDALKGRDLNGCLGVYQGLIYLASRSRDGEHEGFEATRGELAAVCGLSTRRLGVYIDKLVTLKLLQVEVGGGSRPNTWLLSDPPLTLAPPDETSGGTKRQGVTDRPGEPPTKRQGATKRQRKETKEGPPEVPHTEDFENWLAHHSELTGHQPPRTGTKARAALEASYRARRAEGYSEEDLRTATYGAHTDNYRRENGYDVAESVLRPTKIQALINRGRRLAREQPQEAIF